MNYELIDSLNASKPKFIKKIYTAICMLLIASLMVVGTGYAWIVISTAPEAADIPTIVGANGALEIKLNIPESSDKNSLFRNIVEFGKTTYGLDQIVLLPAMPSDNFANGYLQIPKYGYDGLITSETMGASTYVGTLGENGEFYRSDETGVRVVGKADGATARQTAFDNAIKAATSAISSAKSSAQNSLKNDSFMGIVLKMIGDNSSYTRDDVDALGTMISGLEQSVEYLEEAYKQLIFASAASDNGEGDNVYSLVQTLWGTEGLTLEDIAENGNVVAGEYSANVDAKVLEGLRKLQTTKGNVEAARDAYNALDKMVDTYTSGEISPILNKLVDKNYILVNDDDPGNLDITDVMTNGAKVTMLNGAGVYVEIADQVGDYNVEISTTVTMETRTDVTNPYLPTYLEELESVGAPGGTTETLPMNIHVGYIIDLVFKTNAETSNLLLQTEAIDRVDENNSSESTMGGGSFMRFSITEDADISDDKVVQIMSCFRIIFFDTDTNTVLDNAYLDTSAVTYGDDGTISAKIYMENEDGVIASLPQNTPRNISALVYLDAKMLENKHLSATTATSVSGVLNLQFASDAELVPLYADQNTNIKLGPVSNLHFEMIDRHMGLAYDYPDGITEPIDFVLYDINLTNGTTGKTRTTQVVTNSLLLTEYPSLTVGTYNHFSIDSEYHYEVVASAEFDNLKLEVTDKDSTNETIFVQINPNSSGSYYGATYSISGLTPNTPFILYTASESFVKGTDGYEYSWYVCGVSDSEGNIFADLESLDTISRVDNLYFRIIEFTDLAVSEDGLNASITKNIRYNWTLYTDGGVGTNFDQSGTWGNNITWAYTTDGTLTLSGTGAMENSEVYESIDHSQMRIYPWTGLRGRVTNIVIEDGITTVAEDAFGGFEKTETLYLSKDIVEIEKYAFLKCYKIQSIDLPDGLQTIGGGAFRDCTSLTSIGIPNSVTSIGYWAFAYCRSLTSITFEGTVEQWKAIEKVFDWNRSTGDYTVYCTDGQIAKDGTITYYNTSEGLEYTLNADGTSYSVTGIGTYKGVDVVIPSTYKGLPVTSVGHNAFESCRSILSVVIPDGVTSIGNSAFSSCSSLTNVNIPKSVTNIDIYVFRDCISLTSIEVDANNQYYKSIDGNLYTEDETVLIQYAIGKEATSFTIPDSVTSIGDFAFYNCKSLTNVEIPDSVMSIGWAAFTGTSLISIEIPDSVTSVGWSPFASCTALTSVDISNSITSISVSAFYGCTSLTNVEIPNSVTSIDEFAFQLCTSLTSVEIPNSVTNIGGFVFEDCISLTSINFCGTVEQWNAINKDADWDDSTRSYTIYCTDGEIAKNGTVTYY